MSDQVPFAAGTPFNFDNFAENPEPRCPVVLVLDTSGSMRGQPMSELNEGLRAFKDELAADELAAKRVEVAIVGFGPVRTVTDFVSAAAFYPTELQAEGDTPMGAAVTQALSMVEARKAVYRSNGISYYRPWVFLITDGGPTDSWESAAAAAREGEVSRKFSFFAVGVEGARFDVLKEFCGTREPLKLQGLAFRTLFKWLSSSLQNISRSQQGEAVPLADPTSGPTGWASLSS